MIDHSQPFLGVGWAFPPSFGSSGATVSMVSGVEDIHQCLQILLSTRLDERIMAEDFGCNLEDHLFEEVNQSLVNNLSNVITDAVLVHEPRIILDSVDVSEDSNTAGLLLIHLSYTVSGTNSRYNMVYPFYINEASGL